MEKPKPKPPRLGNFWDFMAAACLGPWWRFLRVQLLCNVGFADLSKPAGVAE